MNGKFMNIIDITLENAREQLIDESFKRPVVIDFWAEWCAPCKALMPILAKLADEYAGALLLAKVNADELGMISSQFGVRSLPTVVVMKDGQPVDGFSGALPELQVRELLAKYLPQPWEAPLAQAKELLGQGNATEALPLLRDAYELSGQKGEVACYLAQAHLEMNRIDNAEVILSGVKMADQDSHYQQLKSQIELRLQAAKTPELVALEAAYTLNPDDMNIRYQLALQLNLEASYREALEHLLAILRKERGFAEGDARKTYTAILTSLGKADPLAIEFQRKLFTLLY